MAEREIAPHIAAWDRDRYFPRELYAKLTEAGLMGLLVPERYGGAGADVCSYAHVTEELSRVDAGTGVTYSVHSMVARALAILGSDAQKERWLPKLAGENVIGAFALTEPDAGSDAASLRASARLDGDEWILNGRKQWCTNGAVAGAIMAMLRTSEGGSKGVSAFIIDAKTPGVRAERETDKLGIHTSSTCDIVFEDARVPADALLAAPGEGFTLAMTTLGAGRIGIAAQACGILSAALDASVKFARERMQFGRPIGAFEGVSFKIAEMATDLDAARRLTYHAAALCDAGVPFAVEASKAKLFASKAARRHASEAVQIHGGYGYTTEFPVERYYRDAKITEIYEGTSEIQKIVIARALLGRLD